MDKLCPACGGKKQQAKKAVCHHCYQAWIAEAAVLAQEGEILSLRDWVIRRINSGLEKFRKRHAELLAEFKELQEEVNTIAYERLTEKMKGKSLHPDVFREALKNGKQEVWQERKGNALFASLKEAETDVNFMEEVLQSFEAGAEEVLSEETPTEEAPITE